MLMNLFQTGELSDRKQALYVSGVNNVNSDLYRKRTPNMDLMSHFLERNSIRDFVQFETFKVF